MTMLDLLDDAVAVLLGLLLTLVKFSLVCFNLMLEQMDLKLKSSDLKLIRLELFLFALDFFDGFVESGVIGGGCACDACCCCSGIIISCIGDAVDVSLIVLCAILSADESSTSLVL